MKGRFYKNGGGGRGIFSVSPIKDSFLLSTNHGVEKDSWSMSRKSAPHLQKYTAHCHYAPALSATSMPLVIPLVIPLSRDNVINICYASIFFLCMILYI